MTRNRPLAAPRSWLQDPQFVFPFAADEICVDLFAGGGGASVGLEQAFGRAVDAAVNHNPVALAMHEVNHPTTLHLHADVWEVDPRLVTRGRRVAALWLSPDCTHFSRAKGGTPVEQKIRSLAWVGVDWAKKVNPTLIMLENVPEFLSWGPLMQARDGQGNPRWRDDGSPWMIPDPARAGETFQQWRAALVALGYVVDHRVLRACDYGVPTIRERLFVVARRDRLPIRWPAPTHGAPDALPVREGKLKPHRSAAEIIDWSLPAHSIFLTRGQVRQQGLKVKRPLAESTLRRIARGVVRYVLERTDPFLTAIKGDKEGLTAAHVIKHFTGILGQDARKPLGTVTAIDHHGVVASSLVKLYGTCRHGSDLHQPLPTVTGGGGHIGEVRAQLVRSPFAIKYYGEGGQWQDLREPVHTITGKARLGVVETENQYESTLTEEQRYQAWWTARFIEDYTDRQPETCGWVPVERPPYRVVTDEYVLVDIGLRMLEPHELFRANGFPDDYIHDRDRHGKPFSKAAQIAACGNSVPPALPLAIAKANRPNRPVEEGIHAGG